MSKETLYFKFSWKLFFLCAIQEHSRCGLFLSTMYEHKHHGKILHSAFKTWFVVFLSFQTRTTRAIGSRELSTKFWGGWQPRLQVQIHKQEQGTKKALLHLQACSWRSTAKEEYPHSSSYSPARWALHANVITFLLYSWIPEPCEAVSFPFDENQGSL